MDVEKNVKLNVLSTYCRICASAWQVEYSLQECSEYLSLQCMLEKLFPAIFNAAQRRHDRNRNWPTKICQNCQQKVLLAYELYEQCNQSADLLERLFKEQETVRNDGTSSIKEEYVTDEFVEDIVIGPAVVSHEPTDNTKQNPLEDKSGESIQHDNDQYHPDTSEAQQKLQTKVKQSTGTKMKSNRKLSPSNKDLLKIEDATHPRTRRNRKPVKKNPTSSDGMLENDTPQEEDDKLNNKKRMEKLNEATQFETFKKEENLETKIDLYKCLLCDSPTYSSPNELTEHLKENHRDQIRACAHCPKVFALQSAFEHHQYCHATGRSHFCPFCDKGFQTEPLLKSHIRIHTHRLDYLCSLCGKEFNHKNNLRQHMMCHSGQKPWACSLCPCRFSTKGGLTIHQNTHTKVRTFSCDTCGSQFNKHYSLIKHKLIHTGERPFGCEVCKMRFATNYMVKRHMRTHTGEKPFKCTYCERGFAQSNDLVKHMRMHVGSNPYQCDRCDASFRLLTDLRNHYKDHYQAGEQGAGSSADEDKGIRFTSLEILQLRYKKEMDQQQQGKLVGTNGELGAIERFC